MRLSFQPLVLAAVLAAAGMSSAIAQPAPAAAAATVAPAYSGPQGEAQGPQGRFDPARQQARVQRHFDRLKVTLQIAPQQEGAWNTFVAAMKPRTFDRTAARPDRKEFEQLTTPQRIDRMREVQARRSAAMQARGDAIKTFYAALNPAQQKSFDQIRPPRHGGFHLAGFHGGHRMHGHGFHGGGYGQDHGHGRPDAPSMQRPAR